MLRVRITWLVPALVFAAVLGALFWTLRAPSRGSEKAPVLYAIDRARAVGIVRDLREYEYYRYMVENVSSNSGTVDARVSREPRGWPAEGLDRCWLVDVGEVIGPDFDVWKQVAVDAADGAVFRLDPYTRGLEPLAAWRARRDTAS